MRPSLAVIIVSWNVRDLLRACLHSLRVAQETANADIAIFVVDSASADQSADMVQSEFPEVYLDARTENVGYVNGNNIILQHLMDTHMPDYVWLLNPDTVVTAKSIDLLLTFMEAHPKAGLIGPKLLNPDLSLQECAFRYPGILQPLFDFGFLPQRFYYTPLNGRYPQKRYADVRPFRIDHPLGAAMLARGESVREIGLLDSRFFMYCEEIDWAWRMKKAGWGIWLVPEATIIHHGGASSKQAKAATTAHLWESRAKLYRKHRTRFITALVGKLVSRYFGKQSAATAAWEQAYERIIRAWTTPPPKDQIH